MRTKTKITLVTMLVLTFVMFGLPISTHQASLQATTAVQADGTVGSIQASNQIFHISGSVISVNMFDLAVSSDYNVTWVGNAGLNFTTSSTQTKFTHTFVLTTSESQITFQLRQSSAGTIIDAATVTVVGIGSFLSTGLIISAGIFILIVVIFKRVASR